MAPLPGAVLDCVRGERKMHNSMHPRSWRHDFTTVDGMGPTVTTSPPRLSSPSGSLLEPHLLLLKVVPIYHYQEQGGPSEQGQRKNFISRLLLRESGSAEAGLESAHWDLGAQTRGPG